MNNSDWFGVLPKSWHSVKMGLLFSVENGSTPSSTNSTYWDGAIPWVTPSDMSKLNSPEIFGTERQISNSGLLNSGVSLLPKGTVIISSRAPIGYVCIAGKEMGTNQGCKAFVPTTDKTNESYIYYVLLASKTVLQTLGRGSTFMELSTNDAKSLQVPVPPLHTQRQIATYLDKKTEAIDTLIAKKQRMIELLEEKRSALINHVVTKGLNPDAPMKDSGVPWIGEVPAHWAVSKVKYTSHMFRGKFSHRPRNDPRLYDGKYPFLQTGSIARTNKYISEYKQTLNELGLEASTLFPSGTLVMAIAANVGDVAITTFDACFPDSVIGFKPFPTTDIDFLYSAFLSMNKALIEASTESTQKNLNLESVGAQFIPIPPKVEQLAVGSYLHNQTDLIESIGSKTLSQITKLQEYRQALITAAVTGKIDVTADPMSEDPEEAASEQMSLL